MSLGHYPSVAINEAVEQYLIADSQLLRGLVRGIAAPACELIKRESRPGAMEWWNAKRGGLPTCVAFLEPFIRSPEPPVFAAVSLCMTSGAPTLYVPVPWLKARDGLEGYRETLWINAPNATNDNSLRSVDWSTAARAQSHALANISYAVRVGDRPTLGLLAHAHKTHEPYYVPDTWAEPGTAPAGVRSVATEEERYLAMASVLYLPLCDPLPPSEVLGSKHAAAVLMLWSPVPGYWDNIGHQRLQQLSNELFGQA